MAAQGFDALGCSCFPDVLSDPSKAQEIFARDDFAGEKKGENQSK